MEILGELGDAGLTCVEDMDRLSFTRQVMDETLCHIKLGAFSKRQVNTDMKSGDFVVQDNQLTLPNCGRKTMYN